MRDHAELVKALRYCTEHDNCGSRCPRFDRNEDCVGELTKDAADAIEELFGIVLTYEAANDMFNPQWISVEERLPHYLDHVLCVNKYGIQMVGHLTDYKENGFRCESGMDSCDYITHWMPLPEPPKGVE